MADSCLNSASALSLWYATNDDVDSFTYSDNATTWTTVYPNVIPSPPPPKLIRFHRLGRAMDMVEGASFKEPLDELRVKVAKWLRQ